LQEPLLNPIGIGKPEQQSLKQHHAGNSYPIAVSTSMVRCTAGRAIMR
jgi:hypothetical protein